MATAQTVIDRARAPLNDNDKTRYLDLTLLAYLNQAVLMLRRKRPDLFIGRFKEPISSMQLTSQVQIADVYLEAIQDYITARAETVDADMASEGRAMAFMRLCEGQL